MAKGYHPVVESEFTQLKKLIDKGLKRREIEVIMERSGATLHFMKKSGYDMEKYHELSRIANHKTPTSTSTDILKMVSILREEIQELKETLAKFDEQGIKLRIFKR